MKIGVLQGRLSPPVREHYQEFPDDWELEFDAIKRSNLTGTEWLITNDFDLNNPIYSQFEKIQQLPILSICVDTLVDKRIIDKKYLFSKLLPICDLIKDSKINILTIPILDDSDLSDKIKREEFCTLISEIGRKFPNIKFAFESEMSIVSLNEIVCLCDNFYVTYDTGNITSSGIDHEEYIHFFKEKIINVHLKDRKFNRETVEPTQGDTDFDLIFKNLIQIGYDGSYIIQTARADSGHEEQTINKHQKIFRSIYEKYI